MFRGAEDHGHGRGEEVAEEEEEEGEATTIQDTAMEAMEGEEEGVELEPMGGEGDTNHSLTSECTLYLGLVL